jgi:RHS repeat-associated protein
LLDFGYDARGSRTSVTARTSASASALKTSTAYDAAGEPITVTDAQSRNYGAGYDAASNRTSLTYPNTTSTTYTYDTRNRLTNLTTDQVTSGQPVLVQSYSFTMDAAGRRTRIDEGDGTARVYGYDGIDRLTSETVTGATAYTRTFTYDAVGNRTVQTKTGIGTGTSNYTYDTRDRLLTENATTYAYDTNGNLTSKSGEATYTWNLDDRLIKVVKSDGTTVENIYDADGNRVQTKVTPPSGTPKTTRYLVDTASSLSHVVADVDGATGALSALYVRLGDELLAVMRPDGHGGYTTRYVHHDAIGSVRALTDETGVTTDTKEYEAFGGVVASAGTDPLPYGFAGEAFQTESALAYHRARWMDARVGRFVGMDPFDGDRKRPVSLHRYVYANLNPTNRIDATGRSASNLEWGKIVHDRITEHFVEKTDPWGVANLTIGTVVGGGGSADRPDLVDGLVSAVYDIKTEREFGLSVQIVADYVETMLEDAPQGRPWHPGEIDDRYEPPLTVPVQDPLVFAVVDPPAAGVITYDIYDLRAPVYALGAAGAIALSVGVIGTSVGFGVGLAVAF